MYKLLGKGDSVPADKLHMVLEEVRARLSRALQGRITPKAVYNRIQAPDLTRNAPADNWNQPLALVYRSAKILRESFSDPYFPRRFSDLSFGIDDFRAACDVFGDVVLAGTSANAARADLATLEEFMSTDISAKEKWLDIWRMVADCAPSATDSTD